MPHSIFSQIFRAYGYHLAWTIALVATIGSLYFSEIEGFAPCTYCWYQRILMYPLVLLILVGILKQDEYLPSYVLPLSGLGVGMSLYHYLTQWHVFSQSTACAIGASCSLRYINWFGFVTIPFLALTAFVIITVVMGTMGVIYKQDEGESLNR